MSSRILFSLWGGLFILCAGLGFIPEPQGITGVFLKGTAALFFLPPAVLLYQGAKRKNRSLLQLLRNLSALSLVLTLVLLIANFFTALAPETLGTVLHYVLIIVSTPMMASGYWAVSLFFWACLLVGSIQWCKKSAA